MKKIIIALIRFYRKHISPLKKPCCRFTPTCSQYAIQAVERHGAFLGSLMSVARIIRCNPYCRGGYDPVPDYFTLKSMVGRVEIPSACEKCDYRAECDGQSCDLLKNSALK